MRTSGSAGGPQRITHFSLPCSGKKCRVLLQKKGYLRGKSLLVSFRFSTRTAVCGLRGSNSLPGIPRMAVAIRRNPASPLDLTRFAQVEAASSPALWHISKKNTPSCRMGCSFWSGRRGSNSLPRPWQGRALPDELRPQTAPLLRHLGASGRSRTNDTRIFSPLLYQLSYRGIWRPRRGSNPRPPA